MHTVLLIVEDEPDIRLAYETMSEDLLESVEVRSTASVPEAKEVLSDVLRSGANVFALVDGEIGNERGEDFAQYARSQGKIWIIACSAQAHTWGNDNFRKPFNHAELAACIVLRMRQRVAT